MERWREGGRDKRKEGSNNLSQGVEGRQRRFCPHLVSEKRRSKQSKIPEKNGVGRSARYGKNRIIDDDSAINKHCSAKETWCRVLSIK